MKTPAIDQVARIDPDTFRHQYFRRKRPVHVTDMATQWPALSKWSLPFFAGLADERQVTIENGNVLQGDTNFETRGFRDYVAELIRAEEEGAASATGGRAYLSLFNIFQHFPALRDDVDFSLIKRLTHWHYVFGWLGPAGTLTGYHIDWIDNILAQIKGRKRLWLAPPVQTPFLYPSKKYDFRSTLSSVDPDTWDKERFPLFAQLHPVSVVLEPGHMLFIPRGWWHRVQSLDPSISVNCFAHDLSGILIHQARSKLQDALHRFGLYGREGCTCHKGS